jgi:hypothetical protein
MLIVLSHVAAAAAAGVRPECGQVATHQLHSSMAEIDQRRNCIGFYPVKFSSRLTLSICIDKRVLVVIWLNERLPDRLQPNNIMHQQQTQQS